MIRESVSTSAAVPRASSARSLSNSTKPKPPRIATRACWSPIPEHDVMRRQFMRHFGPPHTPDLILSMTGFVVSLANELLDKVKARGGTRMDVVEDFSYPIPVSVIFRIMGRRSKTNPSSTPGRPTS